MSVRRSCEASACEQRATHFRDQHHVTGMPGYRSVLIRVYACDGHAQYDDSGMWVPIFWAREVK